MKKINDYYLGIGKDDYKVDLIITDSFKVSRVIAKEDINEEGYNYKKGNEVKFSKEEINFIEENLKEEFKVVNTDAIYCELPQKLKIEEMTNSEKVERVKEINSLLMELKEERKQLLEDLKQVKTEAAQCQNTKLENISADELKDSKPIDELIKEALNSKKTAGEVVDNAIKGLKKNDIINILKESGFSFSKSQSKEELIKDIKVTVARKVGFEKIRSNNQKER